jgi:hypothetical protein
MLLQARIGLNKYVAEERFDRQRRARPLVKERTRFQILPPDGRQDDAALAFSPSLRFLIPNG